MFEVPKASWLVRVFQAWSSSTLNENKVFFLDENKDFFKWQVLMGMDKFGR